MLRYSLCFLSSSVLFSKSTKPKIPFIGVLNSCPIFDKNLVFNFSTSFVFSSSLAIETPNVVYKILRVKNKKNAGLGFVVNKNLGSSVNRNLFKRRFRDLYFNFFAKNNIKIGMIILPKRINLKKQEVTKSFELLKKHFYDK